MPRREKLFWLVIGLAFVVGVLSFIPSYYEICEIAEKAKEKDCPSYQFVPFIAIKVGQFLDRAGVAVTALATISIAVFTLTLKKATDRLWDAGENQRKLTEDTAERQLRAYLSATPFYIFKFDEQAPVTIKFRIANHGVTPAHEMSTISSVHVWPHPLPSDWIIEPPPPVGPTWSKSTVYSDTPAIGQATMGRLLSIEEIQELTQADSARRIYVVGVVRYLDIFKKEIRTTKFCGSVKPYFLEKVVKGETFEDQDGVFEIPPRHNEAD